MKIDVSKNSIKYQIPLSVKAQGAGLKAAVVSTACSDLLRELPDQCSWIRSRLQAIICEQGI